MSDNPISPEVAEGVAYLIRNVCNQENNYFFATIMTIGELNYKITISLRDVDPVKEAKVATITIKREDND